MDEAIFQDRSTTPNRKQRELRSDSGVMRSNELDVLPQVRGYLRMEIRVEALERITKLRGRRDKAAGGPGNIAKPLLH
jgi:hypothetical protein